MLGVSKKIRDSIDVLTEEVGWVKSTELAHLAFFTFRVAAWSAGFGEIGQVEVEIVGAIIGLYHFLLFQLLELAASRLVALFTRLRQLLLLLGSWVFWSLDLLLLLLLWWFCRLDRFLVMEK